MFCRGIRGIGGGDRAAGDQGPVEADDPKGSMVHLLQCLRPAESGEQTTQGLFHDTDRDTSATCS